VKLNDDQRAKLKDLLIKGDPLDIYFPDLDNNDEYDSEVEMIDKGSRNVQKIIDMELLFLEVFTKQFRHLSEERKKRISSLAVAFWESLGEMGSTLDT